MSVAYNGRAEVRSNTRSGPSTPPTPPAHATSPDPGPALSSGSRGLVSRNEETEFGGGHEIPSEPLPSTATTDWRRFTSNFVNPPPGGPGGPDAGKRWREGLGDLDAKQDTLEGQSVPMKVVARRRGKARGRVVPSRYREAAARKPPAAVPAGSAAPRSTTRAVHVGHTRSFPTELSDSAVFKVPSARPPSRPPHSAAAARPPSRPPHSAAAARPPSRPPHSAAAARPPSRPPHSAAAVRPPSRPPHSAAAAWRTPRTLPFTPSGIKTSTPRGPEALSGSYLGLPSHSFAGATPTFTTKTLRSAIPPFNAGVLSSRQRGSRSNCLKVERSTPGSVSRLSGSLCERAGQGGEEEEEEEEEGWRLLALQACFIEVQAAKAFAVQEWEAMSQLYRMWVAVETQQKLNAGVREEVVAAEGRRGVATATAALQAGLNSVKQILDRLERDYVAMAMALDSTRHEMPVVGIAPIHEESLQDDVAICEQLLCGVLGHLDARIALVSKLAVSSEAAGHTLQREIEELDSCQDDLEAVMGRQLQSTSLFFESKQRSVQQY